MKSVLVAVAAVGLTVGAFVTPARADVGDGKLACNNGEICFGRDTNGTLYQKHFWYAGSHDGYTFTNTVTGAGGQGQLKDNAAQIMNRDTACKVKVIDDHGIWTDDVSEHSRGAAWQAIKSDVRDQNDRHERC